MNGWKMQRALSAMIATGLMVLVGCGGDIEQGEAPPEDSRMVHASDFCEEGQQRCVIGSSAGEQRDLAVRLLDDADDPVEGALVEFDLEAPDAAADAELSTDGTLTDPDGVADVEFRAGDATGQYDITAEVQEGPEVNDIDWRINVSAKGAASYIVNFDYAGDSDLDAVQPLLFDDDWSCDDLVEDFFEDRTWPNSELSLEESSVHADGTIDTASHHPVDDGEGYTVVGLAYRDSGAMSVDTSFGCTEADPVSGGADVDVDVELVDHVPHLGDRYDTTNHLLMAESLPGPVQTLVDLLGQLAENPAAFIIGGEDYFGLIDDVLFEYLPTETIEDYLSPILENEAVIGVIHDFINDIIEGMLPGWVSDAQQIVTDVTNVLEEFTVRGQFHLQNAPAIEFVDGRPVAHLTDVHHAWDEVIFEWSRGCGDPGTDGYEECAELPLDVSEMTTGDEGLVDGHFDGTADSSGQLDIQPHALSLNYGAMMVAAFEQLIMQRLFGDDASSVDDVIDVSLGDCEELASAVASEDSSLGSVAEGLCDLIVDQVSDALFDYLLDTLDDAGQDQFEMMSPDDQPCQLEQPDEYAGSNWPGSPLPYAETMGRRGEGMGCDWRVEADLPAVSDPAIVEGAFEAELVE